MKYQSLPAFEKYLEAQPKLARVFLVTAPCPYERRQIAHRIASMIEAKEGKIRWRCSEGGQGEIREQMDSLNTLSLLSGQEVLFLDGIDKLGKEGLARIGAYISDPSPCAFLVLGSTALKPAAAWRGEWVTCDLAQEKPWERKDRFKRFLGAQAAKLGKRLDPGALEHLVDLVGLNMPALEQELEKLAAYIGERPAISLGDVSLLCAHQKSGSLWQLADAIAWHDPWPKIDEVVDSNLLFPLFALLRTQLQQGLALASGTPLASMKPAAIDKLLPLARGRTCAFFKRALDHLFEVELMAKNSSLEPTLLLDLLLTRLTLLKRHYALSFA